MLSESVMDGTIAALSTPVGTGGIAIIRISGSSAFEIAQQCIVIPNQSPLLSIPPRYLQIMTVIDHGVIIDQGMVVRFTAPYSATGEDVVELHLHGNMVIVDKVLNLIVGNGARLATPGEFTRRAFLNGKMDLFQVEALSAILIAEDQVTIELVQKQLSGEISRQFSTLRTHFIHLLALLEIELEFSEHDFDTSAMVSFHAVIDNLHNLVSRLLVCGSSSSVMGCELRVGILGLPNAGKSSFFNSLVGYSRSLVSSTPGTTRDYVDESVVIDGHQVRFIDTAGLRTTTDPVEASGIERAFQIADSCDLLLYLIDATLPDDVFSLQQDFIEHLRNQFPRIQVIGCLSKWDLFPRVIPDLYSVCCTDFKDSVSIFRTILDKSSTPDLTNRFYVSRRQRLILIELESLLVNIRSLTSLPLDMFLSETQRILRPLSELTGDIVSKNVLEEVFANFCVGK